MTETLVATPDPEPSPAPPAPVETWTGAATCGYVLITAAGWPATLPATWSTP